MNKYSKDSLKSKGKLNNNNNKCLPNIRNFFFHWVWEMGIMSNLTVGVMRVGEIGIGETGVHKMRVGEMGTSHQYFWNPFIRKVTAYVISCICYQYTVDPLYDDIICSQNYH